MGWLKLAVKYILYHRLKTLILIACIFLTAFLPIAIEILLNEFEDKIVERADRTPLVVGARGSRFDLTLRSLYFRIEDSRKEPPVTIEHGESADIESTGWANTIPIYSKFTAGGFPVVGTTLEYFNFRDLQLSSGDPLVQIGDCVLGATVARQLQLKPGDSLLTDIESVISITAYPLKMRVRGVLERANTPDDRAVFVDLKTAWIIDGIGHGHQNVEQVDEEKLLGRDEEKIVASAAVLPFTEITPANIESFHFHGDSSAFPLTAIIAIPPDEKSETILIGRYRNADSLEQLVIPRDVINELMNLVFQVKRFFDANAILIAVSTILLLILIMLLSIKLREREMQTMFKIGASRNTMALLQIGEIGIIFLFSSVLVLTAVWIVRQFAGDIVQSVLLGA